MFIHRSLLIYSYSSAIYNYYIWIIVLNENKINQNSCFDVSFFQSLPPRHFSSGPITLLYHLLFISASLLIGDSPSNSCDNTPVRKYSAANTRTGLSFSWYEALKSLTWYSQLVGSPLVMSCCWRWLLVYGGFRWLHQPARSAEIARPSIYSPRGCFIFPISARSGDRFFSAFFPLHPRSSKEYFYHPPATRDGKRKFAIFTNLRMYFNFMVIDCYIYGFDIHWSFFATEIVSFRINFSPNFWTSVVARGNIYRWYSGLNVFEVIFSSQKRRLFFNIVEFTIDNVRRSNPD